jgi:putative ABC transport system permease protein
VTDGVTSDIGWVGLATSLVFVAIAVARSAAKSLGIERSILWAATRALVQLLAVGAVLAFVLSEDRPVWVALAWVLAMVLVATVTVRWRVPEVPGIAMIAFGAIGAAAVVGLAVMFGLGIFPFEGRAIVPLAGMIVGNALASCVVVCRRLLAEVADKRLEIEARLALGQAGPDALKPYTRVALRTALLPAIERTKVVGLVALPGAMTGLILAGVAPADAVKVQAAVMFELLGAEAAAVSVVSLGTARRLLTADHRLVRLVRAKT